MSPDPRETSTSARPRSMPAAHALLVLALAVALVAALAGCGSNADETRLKQEQLDRARAEGARQARIDERTKQDRRETERLRKQVEALKKGKGGSTSSSSSTPSASSNAASSASKDCGSGIRANAVTSCPFAQNVHDTYVRDESPTIEVYSPITQKSYTMSCSAAARTVCRGGNSAVVEF